MIESLRQNTKKNTAPFQAQEISCACLPGSSSEHPELDILRTLQLRLSAKVRKSRALLDAAGGKAQKETQTCFKKAVSKMAILNSLEPMAAPNLP